MFIFLTQRGLKWGDEKKTESHKITTENNGQKKQYLYQVDKRPCKLKFSNVNSDLYLQELNYKYADFKSALWFAGVPSV